MKATDFERLGAFYLGRAVDPADGEVTDELVLYDAADLTTHALIVGMTGSGKTGLGVCLLEEAAIDGVPAIVIDPKGDMGNLMLTFEGLEPDDFAPWVDPQEAARAGRTVEEQAAALAELWRSGLSEWGQGPERIAKLRQSAEVALYTPGSVAGLPLNLLHSFAAPDAATLADPEALRERVGSAVQGLLALIGIEADPLTGREHILLANLLGHAWRAGRSLDLAQIIREIQKPPFDQLGVIDLETFYPAKDRVGLAMALNGLLASPGFEVWLQGDPIDAGRLLFDAQGKPRLSVISIAHLNDAQRMFVVTVLLGEVIAWMRRQSGTGSLRALLYMDEIFGFFPPSRNPPSKEPMLTLLKQARAYGLGVVLSTQNPVDLDYKGLANCGTWFLGRLQTERDKERVLDGLETAAASEAARSRSELEDTLSSLGKRVFYLHNVHEDEPVLMHTRWALSYLKGPLGREEIERLTAPAKARRDTVASPPPSTASASAPAPEPPAATGKRPVVADGIEERFLPGRAAEEGERVLYRPFLGATAELHYSRRGLGVDEWRSLAVLQPIDAAASSLSWDDPMLMPADAVSLRKRPQAGASYAELAAVAQRKKAFAMAAKKLKTELYQSQTLRVFQAKSLKERSRPGEDESAFRQRLSLALAEKRDVEINKLRRRYAKKIEQLERRIRTAEERVEREKSQLRDRKLQTAVSFGASVLGALLGRKKVSVTNIGRVGTAAKGLSRSRREADDVERASERLEDLLEEKAELEQELEGEIETLRASLSSPADVEIETVEVRPLKGDLVIEGPWLVWAPYGVDADGLAEPLFELPPA